MPIDIIQICVAFADNCYACDPRIARYKEDEKQKKLAEKQAKRDAAKAKADEEERVRTYIR